MACQKHLNVPTQVDAEESRDIRCCILADWLVSGVSSATALATPYVPSKNQRSLEFDHSVD